MAHTSASMKPQLESQKRWWQWLLLMRQFFLSLLKNGFFYPHICVYIYFKWRVLFNVVFLIVWKNVRSMQVCFSCSLRLNKDRKRREEQIDLQFAKATQLNNTTQVERKANHWDLRKEKTLKIWNFICLNLQCFLRQKSIFGQTTNWLHICSIEKDSLAYQIWNP